MTELFLIVVPAVVVGAICRMRGAAAPIPLVVTGGIIGVLPIVERVHPDPDILLAAVLPPLLFGAALSASAVSIRRNLFAIGGLSVGLVLATAAAVVGAVHFSLPALPLAAALTLGAVLSPADAVATTAVARRVGMKPGTRSLLDGENLLNDGAALTIFNVGVAIMVGGSVTGGAVAGIVAMSVVGGVLIGVVGGYGLRLAVERIDDSSIETTVILLTPYCLFFLCEFIGASGFLAVVIAGLILSHAAGRGTSRMRLGVKSLWSVLTFLLESVAFVLVGFELTNLLSNDGFDLLRESAAVIGCVLAALVVTRVVWVMGLFSIPRVRRRVVSGRPVTSRDAAVVAWAGMRGPVSVFAALAIPLTLDDGSVWPMRDELILVTTTVVIATLVLQGTTLGPLMRLLGVAGYVDEAGTDAEVDALAAARDAADTTLASLLRDRSDLHPEVVERLQQRANDGHMLSGVDALDEADRVAYCDALKTMIDAERAVCFERRADGRLSEEAAQRLIGRLDLQEAALDLN